MMLPKTRAARIALLGTAGIARAVGAYILFAPESSTVVDEALPGDATQYQTMVEGT